MNNSKMKLEGFGIFVKDMATMVRFYRDVLGFEIKDPDTQAQAKTPRYERNWQGRLSPGDRRLPNNPLRRPQTFAPTEAPSSKTACSASLLSLLQSS